MYVYHLSFPQLFLDQKTWVVENKMWFSRNIKQNLFRYIGTYFPRLNHFELVLFRPSVIKSLNYRRIIVRQFKKKMF